MTENPQSQAPYQPPFTPPQGAHRPPQPPHQPSPAQAEPPYKTLRRVRDDRIIAGVCSGIGRYLNVDPNAVRVAFAVLAVVTWGTALLAYPVMWFLMPEEPAPPAVRPSPTQTGQWPTHPRPPAA